MEKEIYSIDDKVDYYLHKIAMAPTLRLDPHDLYEVSVLDEESYLIDQVMLEKGLIKIEREARVITSKGLEISNFGGWTLHQKLLNRDRVLRGPKEEILINKYEEEIRTLKTRIIELENESEFRKGKEIAAYRIINALTKQVKNDKHIYLLSGIVIGCVFGLLLWLAFH